MAGAKKGGRREHRSQPSRAVRRRRRSTLLTVSLGVAAMTGGLFVSGTLDPVVHDVVAYVSSGSSDANG